MCVCVCIATVFKSSWVLLGELLYTCPVEHRFPWGHLYPSRYFCSDRAGTSSFFQSVWWLDKYRLDHMYLKPLWYNYIITFKAAISIFLHNWWLKWLLASLHNICPWHFLLESKGCREKGALRKLSHNTYSAWVTLDSISVSCDCTGQVTIDALSDDWCQGGWKLKGKAGEHAAPDVGSLSDFSELPLSKSPRRAETDEQRPTLAWLKPYRGNR